MSKKLREIIHAKQTNPDRFYTNASHEVIERDTKGSEMATGIYQNEAGTYFTKKAWKKEQTRLEKLRLQKEKAAKKARVKTIPLAEIKNEDGVATTNTKKKGIYLLGAVMLLVGIIITGFFLYSENKEPIEIEPTVKVELEEEPTIFGNAVVTGDDVRMRAGPTLQDSIITYFPTAGERVLILQKATDSILWVKVQRKDATVGWVYSKYVEDSAN
ncbi:SH3 domain-containing protein [Jejudonia soesokkakensis]|uniref:SH3 domain-containing protein n=1 Tax=Jejudonia soesokkakensis TaxID=1323432 RepID=A0ABW2MSN7_9FLAO